MNQSEKEQLEQLADTWLASAKQAYINAERMHESLEDRPTGKIMTEHGATCKMHCVLQLREVIDTISTASSKTPKKPKLKVKGKS